jgi:hypothetical protein
LKFTEVSEENAASDFWVQAYTKQADMKKSETFNPEDGGSTFLQNDGEFMLDYTAPHPRTQYSSVTILRTSGPKFHEVILANVMYQRIFNYYSFRCY